MQKLILLLLILSTCYCSAQDECGQAGGYTGILKETFSNGIKKEENSYLNGVKHGICISFYLDGTIRSKEKYQLGKLVEVILSPDPTHDAKDYKTLHPPQKYNETYTPPKLDPNRKKWKSERIRINDSTESEKGYFDNKLAIERIYIKGDKRYERFYFRDNDVPDSYFNRNYEAHYYYGKLHGESISYFNNGNIKQKGNYHSNEPIGLHYTYYNDKRHIIKSISYYPNINKPYLNKQARIINIKKYDTAGIYCGYEIKDLDHITPSKIVVFTDTSEQHTWSTDAYFREEICNIQGTIENGYYKITSSHTKNKKQVFKNGNYNDYYLSFLDIFNQSTDTFSIPKNKGTHTKWIYHAFAQIASIDIHDYINNNSYDCLDMFALPTEKWKGKLKDGYLAGEWTLKGKHYLHNDIIINIQFSGKFEKSKREGIWKYENDLYQYTINYVNGKKEGELKLKLKNYDIKKLQQKQYGQNERFYLGDGGEIEFPYQSKLPEIYNNALSLMIGSFKNNELHGEWTAYYKYPDLLAYKAVYNQGILIGKTEEYNIKQQLTATRLIQNNRVVYEKLYTPLGDEYDPKFLTSINEDYKLLEQVNNKPDGKYLAWNNYTGNVYEKGFYKKGMKHSEWINLLYGDTLIQNYRNDTLNGYYKYNNSIYHHKYQILDIGSYSMGKKSGLWKMRNTVDSIYKEEVYIDNEIYLTTYVYKNKNMVERGNGIITKTEEGLLTRTEEYYKDGKNYKTVLIYTQNNQIASIIYSTSHGDSIAYYMPPESGTCIKNGTGMKTYFDHKKRISKIEYYSHGKIIKHDLYDNGHLIDTYYFRFASDTNINLKNVVVFEKEINKDFNDQDYLYVTLRITNMPKNIGSLLVTDVCPSGSNIQIIDSVGFSVSRNENGSISLSRSKPVNSNVMEIKYKYNYHHIIYGTNAEIRYSIDKKNYKLSSNYTRIH